MDQRQLEEEDTEDDDASDRWKREAIEKACGIVRKTLATSFEDLAERGLLATGFWCGARVRGSMRKASTSHSLMLLAMPHFRQRLKV